MSAAKPGVLRVVLDTNVYVSAFLNSRGAPFQVWQKAVANQYTLLISPPIIREIADVLRADLQWPETEIVSQLKLLARVAEIIAPKITLKEIADDPDDDRILECAVSGRADLIVSGDHHLQRLKTFRGIAIIRPVDFQRTLG